MVDLALAKEHLEYEDDDRDDLIEQYIAAAAAWVEGFTGVLLTRRAVTRRFPSSVCHYDVNVGPDPVVDSLTYLDSDLVETTIAAEDYTLVGGRLYPVPAFPYAQYGIVATVTAGFDGDVPADLISAQLLILGHLFATREAVNVGNIVSEVPLSAKALCQPYCLVLV